MDPEQAPPTDSAVPNPLGHLLEVLQLARVGDGDGSAADPDHFRGQSVHQPTGRVYGGQVLAQAVLAAGRTVQATRLPHSLHGYFLRPGVLDVPIDFAVERLRDGRSFSARRTHAIQHGKPILSMIASFQEHQPGIDHSTPMPDAPPPEEAPSALDVLGGIDHPIARFWSHHSAFELRHVGGSLYLSPGSELTDQQMVWMRARGPVGDDQLMHRALMAYACDQVMLEPILRSSGTSWVTPDVSIASLDHAMWWHRDVRVDEWLLYVQSASSAQGGRGLGAARVFSQDGTLVASIAQEGMVRLPVL
ncbi:acyl-CoA thioesterase [Oerskovia flava]|uniref:acyl-CoA thioesterase n=1 Tax=Oerskovia flava TaxID=2986422 RepID=UPI00223FCA13|nr:acyl-CoA thioesterase II [Oerskovia sp. JB1-3-2]